MPKETKAQRAARIQAEDALRRNAESQEYPQKLMSVFERLAKCHDLDYNFYVKDGKFVVSFLNESSFHKCHVMNYSYDELSYIDLYDLELKINDHEERRKEKQRLYQVKQDAIAKAKQVFDEEQLKLLGLI